MEKTEKRFVIYEDNKVIDDCFGYGYTELPPEVKKGEILYTLQQASEMFE